jgi:hypothetical protein
VKGSRLYISGALPTAAFGVEVHGLSNAQLRGRQRQAVACMSTHKVGSLVARLVLKEDPHCYEASACLLKWCQMVYKATNEPEIAKWSLPQLRDKWELCQHMLPKKWCNVRGPMGAMSLEVARLGWKQVSPFELETHLGGDRIILTVASPAFMKHWIKRAHQHKLECKLGVIWGSPDPVRPDAVLSLMGKKNASGEHKAILQALFTDYLWPAARLHDIGYLISPTCSLCGVADDSFEHRVFRCKAPIVVEARREVISDTKLKQMMDVYKDLPVARALWHGGVPDHWGSLQNQGEQRLESMVDGVWTKYEGDSKQFFEKDKALFSDGSCDAVGVMAWRRSGWGLAQMSDDGSFAVKRAFGSVERVLPQTAPAAEWHAYVQAHRL